MGTVGWVALVIVAWSGAAVLVAVALGRIVRRRDFEVDGVVQTEMDGVDDEYAQLCGGER